MEIFDDDYIVANVTIETDEAREKLAELEQRAERFGNALSSALKSAALEGKSFENILKGLALELSTIALSSALKPLGNSFGNLLNGILPFAKGGVPNTITPFANGGIVSTPTFFPMGGGQLGLMGEAGNEAILPLSRGPDGSLGVVNNGGGQAVNITFNISTPDADSFRKSEGQISSMLARTVSRGHRSL